MKLLKKDVAGILIAYAVIQMGMEQIAQVLYQVLSDDRRNI